ncbi:hypothetical protein MRX96_005919 [Rhipicephalus microplus]
MFQCASNSVVINLLVFLILSQASFQYVNAKPRQEEQDETVVTIDDIQRLGEARMDTATRSYIASGAEREQTLKENTAAFSRLRFKPRSLVDVSSIRTGTTVLGHRISFPVGFSPSAAHMIAHKDGEFGTAQAARDAGTLMIVSAMSTATMEDIRASAPECLLWQQMYIFKNRSLTESMIRRAERQGFGAIVVTVDSPVTGQAVSLGKHMFVLPDGLRFANLEASSPGSSFTFDPSKEGFIGNLLSSSATWDDFRWLRTITTLPLVAKGVLTAESALSAYHNGASAVLVSNHGARQLDGDPATGKKGADKVLDILRSEFNRTIQLLGVPDANKLCTDFVVREPYYSEPLPRNCQPTHLWSDFVPHKVTK